MMKFLEDVPISGLGDIREIKEIFGRILIGFNPAFDINLSVLEIFPNIFRTSTRDRKKDDLIFVVVPDATIESVRIIENYFDETAYCTARVNKKIITKALAARKKNLTLYLCLTKNGEKITAVGQLGI